VPVYYWKTVGKPESDPQIIMKMAVPINISTTVTVTVTVTITGTLTVFELASQFKSRQNLNFSAKMFLRRAGNSKPFFLEQKKVSVPKKSIP
jgi:hypothetical protein